MDNVPEISDEQLTTAQAAEIAHVSEAVIYQWVTRGYLPKVRVRVRGSRRIINAYNERDVLRCEKARRDNGKQATQRWLDQ
jgi:predicted site-specific integrase-resolvase